MRHLHGMESKHCYNDDECFMYIPYDLENESILTMLQSICYNQS